MACCCGGCVINDDCVTGDQSFCCGGTCVEVGCCVISIELSCQAYCDYGCKVIVGGPNNGKFNCYQDICNDFP